MCNNVLSTWYTDISLKSAETWFINLFSSMNKLIHVRVLIILIIGLLVMLVYDLFTCTMQEGKKKSKYHTEFLLFDSKAGSYRS